MVGMDKGAHQINEDESESEFIDEDDVIDEISIDEEDLPDADVEGEDVQEDNRRSEPDENSSSLDDAIHTFEGHEDTLFAVACSPVDATWVASGGGDDKAFMWRIGHATPFFELKGHTDSVVALSFSNDGLLLASGGLDGVVRIWDASTGNLIHVLDGPGGGIEWIRWHPKGHLVLAGSEDYSIWMWNADLGKCLSVYTGHCESVTCGDFTPDGKTICTGSADGSLRVWNPQTQESKFTVKGYPYHTEGLTCLSISSDSTLVVSGSTDGSVHVVNIKNGKVVGSLVGHSGSIECVGFSPSLTWVATGGMDKKLMIWELQSSSLRCTCQHEEGVMRLSWSFSSQHIITASLDGIVRLWDSRSGVCERVFEGHSDSIQDMVVTVDQRFILTGSDDTTAKVFEIGAF